MFYRTRICIPRKASCGVLELLIGVNWMRNTQCIFGIYFDTYGYNWSVFWLTFYKRRKSERTCLNYEIIILLSSRIPLTIYKETVKMCPFESILFFWPSVKQEQCHWFNVTWAKSESSLTRHGAKLWSSIKRHHI